MKAAGQDSYSRKQFTNSRHETAVEFLGLFFLAGKSDDVRPAPLG
jgi:hypothetical protein